MKFLFYTASLGYLYNVLLQSKSKLLPVPYKYHKLKSSSKIDACLSLNSLDETCTTDIIFIAFIYVPILVHNCNQYLLVT